MAIEEPVASWHRTHYEPGGDDAFLFYKIHGTFRGAPAVSRSRHRCAGVPEGCDLFEVTRENDAELVALGVEGGYIGDELRRTAPALFAKVVGAEQCLVLRGDIRDPETLDYLRDAVGLIMALLEQGGVAVLDAQTFLWFSADQWRERIFAPAAPVPRHHAVILISEEDEPGRRWYHTRGLRKFGRPDVSVHGVTSALEPDVLDLCNRMIEMQAFGVRVPDGHPIRMRGIPDGWVCRHGGDLDDFAFNNRHLAIGP